MHIGANKHDYTYSMKFIGLIGLSVWASFTVAFNLAVGHIRSLYEESANLVNLGELQLFPHKALIHGEMDLLTL